MDRRRKHLGSEERGVIRAEHDRGGSQRAIGRLLRRPARTICRELGRGRQADGSYCPEAARRVYGARQARCRRHRKPIEGSVLHRFVHDPLVHRCWSREQIAQRPRRMKPADPAARVSHETIHAAIHTQPRGGLKAATVEAPRQAKPVRGRRRTSCPVTGEGDLIKGAFNRSSAGTLVERRTRFVVLRKMRGNGADAVLDSFDRQMKRLPAAPRRSMTRDRGSEMACLPEPAQRLKIDIWSCDPHAPGSAAATRTPTACCVSSGRREPT